MTEQDKELSAITALVAALADLDDDGRVRVLEYVTKRFGIGALAAETRPDAIHGVTPTIDRPAEAAQLRHMDIKALKEEKEPSSAIQMAVLVAYYLANVVPHDERKNSITTTDFVKYFNQARYPLPTGKNGPRDTLNNARRAGYFESAGHGAFKLNSVGFNLAAYNMPTSLKSKSRKS